MCGIFALFEPSENATLPLSFASESLKHRGPDSTGSASLNLGATRVNLLHTRLRINGNSTEQPLRNADDTLFLVINGEIFNWKQLQHELNYTCTSSDCEVLLPLYERYKDDIPAMMQKLEGQFSFVLVDTARQYVLVGRDPIGVTPLYIGTGENGTAIASEMKCLTEHFRNITIFNPRSFVYQQVSEFRVQIEPQAYESFEHFTHSYTRLQDFDRSIALKNINRHLTYGVKNQLEDLVGNQNTEFGVLLSGGLDSSLIAKLVVDLAKELGHDRPVRTFSIGVDQSVPDLVAARRVAEYLGTEHHEYHFSIQEGIQNLENVVRCTETYDCTTIRASTPMYLLTRKIKHNFPRLKVLFSGELSDELLCYLYGANAPSPQAFQEETVNLVSNVHLFDCLRANKTCMANSIEVRVPFTDIHYVKYVLSLPPEEKMFGHTSGRMEKQLLRDAFKGYLPNDILYRKKEQFSDGVSGFSDTNNWIDGLKRHASASVSNDEMKQAVETYGFNTPNTKEKYLFRKLFHQTFHCLQNNAETCVKEWKPNWSSTEDPSGRAQDFWVVN